MKHGQSMPPAVGKLPQPITSPHPRIDRAAVPICRSSMSWRHGSGMSIRLIDRGWNGVCAGRRCRYDDLGVCPAVQHGHALTPCGLTSR